MTEPIPPPSPTAPTSKEALNNSIAKAITILNAFSHEQPQLRLKEISALTGINQATAYRMLNTLKEYNLIAQQKGLYALGRGFLKYEAIVLHSMEIRNLALPFLIELSNHLKANVNLAILDGREVVYVARAETPYCVYGYFHIGMRRPAHCTALGKVLLCQTPELVSEIFKNGVIRYTLNTITDEAVFAAELEKARLQGYALDAEEWNNGINCIAAPVYDLGRKIIAGVSISGPTSTYPLPKILEYIPVLIDYTHRISGRLGVNNGW